MLGRRRSTIIGTSSANHRQRIRQSKRWRPYDSISERNGRIRHRQTNDTTCTGMATSVGLPNLSSNWLNDELNNLEALQRDLRHAELSSRRAHGRQASNVCQTDKEACIPDPLATRTGATVPTRRQQVLLNENNPERRPFANKPPRVIDLPSFKGAKDESINRFIDRFEKILVQQRTHPSDWYSTLTTCLRGGASDYIDRRNVTGYENVIKALKDKYSPSYLDIDALTDVKQAVNETATDYGARLRSIPAMDFIDERERLRVFQRGLRPSIRSRIMLFEPKSFDEALQKADHAERLPIEEGATVQETTTYAPTHESTPDVNDLVTSAVHSAVQQAIRPVEQRLHKTVYNARQQTPTYQQRDNYQNNYPGRQDTVKRCYECGSPTHVQRNCYQYINNNNSTDDGRRINVPFQNGHKPFKRRRPFQQGRFNSRPVHRNNSEN